MTPHKSDDPIVSMEQALSRLEADLQVRYSNMGKRLLELAEQEQREVNRLVDDMISIRKKLANAKHEIQCDHCLAFNAADSKYCKRCGAKITASDEGDNDYETQ